jgi:hypothetical protein
MPDLESLGNCSRVGVASVFIRSYARERSVVSGNWPPPQAAGALIPGIMVFEN